MSVVIQQTIFFTIEPASLFSVERSSYGSSHYTLNGEICKDNPLISTIAQGYKIISSQLQPLTTPGGCGTVTVFILDKAKS